MFRYMNYDGELLMDFKLSNLRSYLVANPQLHVIDTYYDIVIDSENLSEYLVFLNKISGIYVDTAGQTFFAGKDGLKRKQVSFNGYLKHSFIPRRNGTVVNERGEILDSYPKKKTGKAGAMLYLSEGTALKDLKK